MRPRSTFGIGGKITTGVGAGNSASASALALQPDGRIVVAGFLNNNFALVRYTPDASLDLTFGAGGGVITDVGGEDVAHALALQPDGKIVVAGRSLASGHRGFALVRHNPDGSPDLSFGSAGTVTTDFADFVEGRAVALQPDGKIVLAGGPKPLSPANNTFAVARYNANGSLDLTFRAGGKVTTDMGGDDFAAALALQPDGKIVVAGSTMVFDDVNLVGSFALARYTPNGHIDLAFGAGGKVITNFGDDSLASARALALQSDSKIVVAGDLTTATTGTVVFAWPATIRGQSGITFGGVGTVATDFAAINRRAPRSPSNRTARSSSPPHLRVRQSELRPRALQLRWRPRPHVRHRRQGHHGLGAAMPPPLWPSSPTGRSWSRGPHRFRSTTFASPATPLMAAWIPIRRGACHHRLRQR